MATLFYIVSKVGFFLIQPSNLCLLLTITGLVLARSDRFRRLGGRLAAIGVAALLIAGFTPFGNVVILPLEERFPRPAPADLGAVDGIIILGGFEEARVTKGRHALAVNEAAERLTEAVRLARRFPSAKVVFTGGTGTIVGKGEVAGAEIRDFLIDAGVAPERILLEEASRNTRENATLTRALVKPQPGSRWLLVTSAYHMPRSVGIFRRAGFTSSPGRPTTAPPATATCSSSSTRSTTACAAPMRRSRNTGASSSTASPAGPTACGPGQTPRDSFGSRRIVIHDV